MQNFRVFCQGPRASVLCWIENLNGTGKKAIPLGPLQRLIYAKSPYSNFKLSALNPLLFSLLEFCLIFMHLAEALGPEMCYRSKSCIIEKGHILARPFRAVLCKIDFIYNFQRFQGQGPFKPFKFV